MGISWNAAGRLGKQCAIPRNNYRQSEVLQQLQHFLDRGFQMGQRSDMVHLRRQPILLLARWRSERKGFRGVDKIRFVESC